MIFIVFIFFWCLFHAIIRVYLGFVLCVGICWDEVTIFGPTIEGTTQSKFVPIFFFSTGILELGVVSSITRTHSAMLESCD